MEHVMSEPENQQTITTVVKNAINKHGATGESLIPILSEVNSFFGYIPTKAFSEIKKQIRVPGSRAFVSEGQLFGLASFYQMLSTKPLGRHVIRFCESAPCHVMGGRQVIQTLKEQLSLEPGDTSPDGKWSMVNTSCLGICGVGPVILIDEDVYGNLTPEQIPDILARYQ
jgi:NADH:ubiquinone oxidoreductase subunit E